MKRLQNKVAIITGGANGIGLQTAEIFAKEGASVVIADYDEENGKKVMGEMTKENLVCKYIHVDVSNFNSVKMMVQNSMEQFGRIDVLINNAGITQDAMLSKMDEEQFQKVLDVNLNGVFYCAQSVIPIMLKHGKGKIINTSSVSGVYGNVGQTNYAASKAGVIGMTKTWAKELGGKGINVNAIVPGFIETNMVNTVPEKFIDRIVSQIPVQRLGNPKDIANAYLFLASEESNYINGHALHVDGGIMM